MFMKRIAPLLASALLLSGCPAIATGVNSSAISYPTPGEDGAVQVYYEAPADVTQVTFKVDGTDLTALDDSADDGFIAAFDASALDPGFYVVNVFHGEAAETPDALLAFVKPDPNLAQPTEGEGEAAEETPTEETAEEES